MGRDIQDLLDGIAAAMQALESPPVAVAHVEVGAVILIADVQQRDRDDNVADNFRHAPRELDGRARIRVVINGYEHAIQRQVAIGQGYETAFGLRPARTKVIV